MKTYKQLQQCPSLSKHVVVESREDVFCYENAIPGYDLHSSIARQASTVLLNWNLGLWVRELLPVTLRS